MKKAILILLDGQILSAGGYTSALFISFFISFLFNAYLGRVLSFTDFGVITFIGSVWLVTVVFLNALSLTLSHSLILRKHESTDADLSSYFRQTRKKVFIVAVIVSVLWIVFASPINAAFSLHSTLTVILLTPLFIAGVLAAVNRGYLQAFYKFSRNGFILVSESVVKLVLAFLLVGASLTNYVYLSIPFSVITAYVVSQILMPRIHLGKSQKVFRFPKHFYVASLMTILSTTLLFTFDVILAKLFLPPEIAGRYALLSVIGKMIYFFGSLLNSIMVPFITSRIAKNQESGKLFYRFAFVSLVFTILAFLFVGPLGNLTLPILFGEKVTRITSYLLPYSLAMSFFTFTNIFIVYNLLNKHYIFPFLALFFSILMMLGIVIFHSGITQIVNVLLALSIVSFFATLVLHFNLFFRNKVESRLSFLKLMYE